MILRVFDAREWLRLVDRHRVTCTFMVPAHFIRILEVPEAAKGYAQVGGPALAVAFVTAFVTEKGVFRPPFPKEVFEIYPDKT